MNIYRQIQAIKALFPSASSNNRSTPTHLDLTIVLSSQESYYIHTKGEGYELTAKLADREETIAGNYEKVYSTLANYAEQRDEKCDKRVTENARTVV